jgi:murein DD-endopeptidase MepM/ murein hydrolase activator NlpD
MVNEGITEGYVISEEGLTKIRQGINDLDDAISAQIDSTGQNKIIDTGKATAALDAEKAKLGKFASRADIDAVEAARADFTDRIQRSRAANEGKISAADAQELKRTYGREIGDAWKTNDTPATIDAKKAIYSAFREELEAQFPEIGGLNAKQSARINLEKAGRAAVEKAANKTVIPYRAGIVGGGLQILTGDPGIAGTAALMAEAMKYPGFSSRLAIAISRGSGGKVSAVMARARVGEWTRALGQAVEDAESGDGQATQQAP